MNSDSVGLPPVTPGDDSVGLGEAEPVRGARLCVERGGDLLGRRALVPFRASVRAQRLAGVAGEAVDDHVGRRVVGGDLDPVQRCRQPGRERHGCGAERDCDEPSAAARAGALNGRASPRVTGRGSGSRAATRPAYCPRRAAGVRPTASASTAR